MKLMLGELAIINQGISAIANEKIPIITTYWLTRNADEIISETNAFEKSRLRLIDDYAKKDKDGRKVLNKDKRSYKMKNMEKFQEEFAKLAETEVDVNLKVFELADFGKVDISISDLRKLKPIIKDFIEKDKKSKNEISKK